MGGRPSLELGTYGKIRYHQLPDGRVQARALFRDFDGHTRPVTRIGASKAAADRALKKAMTDRRQVAGDDTVRSDMRITELADAWLERIDASDKAVNTKQQYRKLVDAYIRPALGQLRLQEATVPACDRALAAIAAQRGASVGKSCRSVLSGMLGMAVRHGALPVNPVRETEPIAGASKPKKGRPRALTPAESDDITDRFRTVARALTPSDTNPVGLDVADLVDLALATGARIGELLACRDETLDLEAGTWEVNATIVRVKGQGLLLQRRTKTDAGWRVLALPPFAVDMLHARRQRPRLKPPHGVVFGSPTRPALRDPSNTAGDLRACLRLLGGYEWVTFHTFRKTVITRMLEAGLDAGEVADHAGHSKPSMTLNVYRGRDVTSAKAADILNR